MSSPGSGARARRARGVFEIDPRRAAAAAHAAPASALPFPPQCAGSSLESRSIGVRAGGGLRPHTLPATLTGVSLVPAPTHRQPHLSPWTSHALLCMTKVSHGHEAKEPQARSTGSVANCRPLPAEESPGLLRSLHSVE